LIDKFVWEIAENLFFHIVFWLIPNPDPNPIKLKPDRGSPRHRQTQTEENATNRGKTKEMVKRGEVGAKVGIKSLNNVLLYNVFNILNTKSWMNGKFFICSSHQ
jgi:hypothetical protein